MKHFIDAHCHFNQAAFAGYSGPGHFICNSVTTDDWGPIIAAATKDKCIHPAIGLHPWHVCGANSSCLDELRRLLTENPSVMVGEIGLDAARDNLPVQCDMFAAQYLIAAEMKRSAHTHCVRAWDKMLHFFKALPTPPVVVAHRFSGNANILASACAISDSIYFSYRDVDAARLGHVVAQTPMDRILVETDGAAPDMEKIRDAISNIAQIHGKTFTDMADIIYDNSLRVINNGQTA
ncbi:MAG: TatD family hydrolase [Alphaproteobacteria bacterium]|nr:TatD family hydrolase [Alphaproteobacteria bacterium]